MVFNKRKKHLSQVQCAQVSQSSDCTSLTSPLTSSQCSTSTSQLSVTVESAAEIVNVPLSCLRGVWEKAEKLIGTINAITSAPGQQPVARMVLSYSGNVPHMVLPKKIGDFSCDAKRPNWKAMAICSHTVAIAEVNGKLQQFLSHEKRKRGFNVTMLLTTSVPRGRGRKGGVSSRIRTPARPVATRIEMDATSFELSASSRTLFEPTQASATTVHFQTPSALPVNPQTLFEHTQASATSGCSQTPFEPSASSTNYPHHPQTLTESSAIPYTPSYSQHCHSVFNLGVPPLGPVWFNRQ